MARGIGTKCLHLEEEEGCCKHYGAVSYPIFQTVTFAHPGAGQSTGYDYSRLQNPTREQLEKMAHMLHIASGGKKGAAKVLYEADFLKIYEMANR